MPDPEYEVETVIAARVSKNDNAKARRSQPLVWKYRVRWKGYAAEEDTWEPIQSFDGSAEMISKFWTRVDTGGRSIDDLSLFRLNEQLFPVGPPRGKRPQNPSTQSASEAQNKRRRLSANTETAVSAPPISPTPVAPGGSPSASCPPSRTPRKRKQMSPEIIPASEDESEVEEILLPGPIKAVAAPPNAVAGPSTTFSQDRTIPRVKRINLEQVVGTPLSKSRAPRLANASPQNSKPGPGRSSRGLLTPLKQNKSSLLTSTKDGLATLPGYYRLPQRKPEPNSPIEEFSSPPTADELLKLSGLDRGIADALDDFEEEEARTSTKSTKITASEEKTWANNTIFGPLRSGSGAQPSADQGNSQCPSALSLPLRISSSLPILFTDIQPSSNGSSSLDTIASRHPTHSPIGVFFSPDVAAGLVASLRGGGSMARVSLSEDSPHVGHQSDYGKFHQKLKEGKIFVTMSDVDVLLFWASEFSFVSERLNLPVQSPGDILATRVTIADPLSYSNLALEAQTFTN